MRSRAAHAVSLLNRQYVSVLRQVRWLNQLMQLGLRDRWEESRDRAREARRTVAESMADMCFETLERRALFSTVVGDTGNNILNGEATADTIQGLGGNDVLNGFGGNDRLEGGTGDDIYKFRSNWGTDTVVEDSNAGTDTLDFAAVSSALNVTVNGGGVLTVTQGSNGASGSNIEKVIGGSGTDTLDLSGISGGLTFTVSATGEVVITGAVNLTVSGVENFKAGSGNDTFIFQKGAKVDGWVDGGGGTNVLSFSSNPSNADFSTDGYDGSVQLKAPSDAASGTDGNATGVNAFAPGGVKNFTQFVGGRGADDLTAGDYASTLTGGRGNDSITGGSANDSLTGGENDDTVLGNGGNDTIVGGYGDDSLDGGAGNDELHGDGPTGTLTDSDDTLVGGAGSDTLVGGLGNDVYRFADGSGQDAVTEAANEGKDAFDFSAVTGNLGFTINASGVNVTTSGQSPEQTVTGAASIESLVGGKGVNTYTFGATWANEITIDNGATGAPTAILDLSAVTGSLTIVVSPNPANAQGNVVTITGGSFKVTAKNVASIIGGSGGTTVTLEGGATLAGDLDLGTGTGNLLEYSGSTAVNVTIGGSSYPQVSGTVTHVQNIIGGDGKDTLTGDSAANTLTGGDGNDTIDGKDGNNTLYGQGGNDAIRAGAGNDVLDGGAGDDSLDGGNGNNTLTGGAGDDTLVSGTGDDSLSGGAGDNTYVVKTDWGLDTIKDGDHSTGAKASGTIDMSAVTKAVTYTINAGGLQAGTGVFTRDTFDYGIPSVLTATLQRSSGTFAYGEPVTNPNDPTTVGDTLTVSSLLDIGTLRVGTGGSTILVGDKWGSLRVIDLTGAGTVALDFSGSVEGLSFTFQANGDVLVEKKSLTTSIKNFINDVTGFLEQSPTLLIKGAAAGTTLTGGSSENTYVFKQGATFAGKLVINNSAKWTGPGLLDTSTDPKLDKLAAIQLKGVTNNFDFSQMAEVVNASAFNFGLLPSLQDVKDAWNTSDWKAALQAFFTSTPVKLPGIAQAEFKYNDITARLTTSTKITYPGGLNALAGTLGDDTFDSGGLASLAIMSGGVGSDTYRFGPYLNTGVVLELPEVAGAAGSFVLGMDTLDLGDFLNDLDIEIHPVTSGNHSAITGMLDLMGVPTEDIPSAFSTGDTYVLVYPVLFGHRSPVPIVFANGIENIVGGHGTNNFEFFDGAELDGAISTSRLGKLNVVYSGYNDGTSGVTVDGTKGLVLDLGTLDLGFFSRELIYSFGATEGVKGFRLRGFSEGLEEAIKAATGDDTFDFANFAMRGMNNITGSPGNDVLRGTPGDNVIDTYGGLDQVASGGGHDTLILGSNYGKLVVDLSQGKYWPDASLDLGTYPTAAGSAAPTLTAPTAYGTISGIEGLVSLAGNDLIIGTTASETFIIRDQSGSDLIYTGGGKDVLDLRALTHLTSVDTSDGLTTVTYTGADGTTQTLTVVGAVADIKVSDSDAAKIRKTVADLAGGTSVTDNLVATSGLGTSTSNALLLADVAALATAARARWAPQLASADQGILAGITYTVVNGLTDAAGNRVLSRTTSSNGQLTISLDASAMGWGWFKDATPNDDAEFTPVAGTPRLNATTGGTAAGLVDALTVIMHEMGHVLGAAHTASSDALMNPTIATGERINPGQDGQIVLSDQQTITAGLEKTATWVQGFSTEIDAKLSTAVPFTSHTIGDYVSVNGTGATTGAKITDWISQKITAQVESYFLANPSAATASGLAAASNGAIRRSNGSNSKEFEATVTLASYHGQFTIDLSGASFGGIGLTDGGNSLSLGLDASISLTFRFGIDASNHFYVSSPGLDMSLDLGNASVPVGDVDLAGNAFALGGDQTGKFQAGDVVFLADGEQDYGWFHVVSSTFADGVTQLVLQEPIPQSDPDGDGTFAPAIGTDTRVWSTFDLAAKIGPVALGIQDGTIVFSASAHVGTDATIGIAALNDTSTATFHSLVGASKLGGSSFYKLDLPIELTTPFAGLSGAVGRISATSPDLPDDASDLAGFVASIPQSLTVESSLGQILNLRSVSLDQLLNGVITGIDALTANGGVMNQVIPGINRTLADLLGGGTNYLTKLRDAVDTVRSSLQNIQDLESSLNAQFNSVFGANLDPIHLRYEGSALAVDFDLSTHYHNSLAFNLNLADYVDLSAFGNAIDLSASSTVDVDAFAGVHIGAVLDLSNVLSPAFSISDDSGITVSASVVSTAPLNFSATVNVPVVGAVGLQVIDGSIDIGASGHLGFVAGTTAIEGHAIVNLPLYLAFGTPLPVGGTTEDKNSDGVGDNVLRISAGFDSGGLTGRQVSPISLAGTFDVFAYLNNPANVLAGIEGIFSGIKAGAQARFDQIGLPLLDDKLSEAGKFVDDLRDQLLGVADRTQAVGTLGRYDSSGLGHTLLAGAAAGKTTVDVIKDALFDAMGDLLVVPDLDANGLRQYDADGNLKYREVTSADDIQLTVTPDGIAFNVMLAGNIFDQDVDLSFDLAAPGLGLSSGDSKLHLTLDYQFGLGFGFGRHVGLYVDTTGVTQSGAEIALSLNAQLEGNEGFSAQLGFLKATLIDAANMDPATYGVDADADGRSRLHAGISLDLIDASHDGKWAVGSEGLELSANLNAYANVDMAAAINIDAGSITLPSITTVIHYDQQFANITLSSASGNSFALGGKPKVVFENVQLDLGQAISGFIGPIAAQLNDYIGPDSETRRIVDILTTPIDLGVAQLTLIDLARIRLTQSQFNALQSGVNAIKEFSDFIGLVAAAGNNSIKISFGDFTIGDSLLGSKTSQVTAADTQGSKTPDLDAATSGNANSAKVVKKFGTTPGSIQFPILQNPSSILGLLMGRDVDLFLYHLPSLDFTFSYQRSFPVFPGLNAVIGGSVTASTDLDFGFNTRGFNQWKQSGFEPDEIGDVFNGFYFGDWDSNGNEKPEVSLTAEFSAGVSLGVSGLVEAGVKGGITAAITLDLDDVPRQGTGINGIPAAYDGRLYLDEIATRVVQSPLCLFDIHGEVRAFMEAYLWIGIDAGLFTITFFQARERFVDALIAEFDHTCPTPQDDVAYLDPTTHTLTLRRIEGHQVEAATSPEAGQEADNYNVSIQQDDFTNDGVDNPTDWLVVNGNGTVEYFDPSQVSNIVVTGTGFDDKYVFESGVDANITVNGGDGNDRITIKSAAAGKSRVAYGDAGDDTVIGSSASDTIYGGGDNDVVAGNGGPDVISGGDGDDRLYSGGMQQGIPTDVANDEGDSIEGGAGDDSILGGVGSDTLLGGTGNDYVDGGAGNDVIYGVSGTSFVNLGTDSGRNSDILRGGSGTDTIYGGDGDDLIVGGTSAGAGDVLYGKDGADTFLWNSAEGAQTIYGGDASTTTNNFTDKVRLLGFNLDAFGASYSTTVGVTTDANGNPVETATSSSVDVSAADPGTADDVVLSASGADVSATWNNKNLLLKGILDLDVDTGSGADSIQIGDLSSTTLQTVELSFGSTRTIQSESRPVLNGSGVATGGNDTFNVLHKATDTAADQVTITGTSGNDTLAVENDADFDPDNNAARNLLKITRTGGIVYRIYELTASADQVVVLGGAGNDTIDASGLTSDLVDDLRLIGGTGNDSLVGSDYSEILIGGAGADTITGGRGVDVFISSAYPETANEVDTSGNPVIDTLVEQRDANFTLSDSSITIGTETETLSGYFENVELTGGDSANTFTLRGWSRNGLLDGGQGGDTYDITLATSSVGRNFLRAHDTGVSGIDTMLYRGSSGADVIQLDTVYVATSDPTREFTQNRWTEYGRHGDGLLIAHFNSDSSQYAPKDVNNSDALMAINTSSLGVGNAFQVVNYSTVEEITVMGGVGDDKFVSDDTAQQLNVYGNEGNDQFYIGSVLETETVIVEGREVTVVKQITHGASFLMNFYGGAGDDYFEVNHNQADVNLYGDNGDDTFFIKALLKLNEDEDLTEVDNKTATVSGVTGDGSEDAQKNNDTRQVDVDSLVYVENANIKIDGGAGFDSVAVVGTVLSDTFFVFTEVVDGKTVQRIYGAGVKLRELVNVERIQLLTGPGDDRVYLYGADLGPVADTVINTGTGSDTVYVGGPQRTIDLAFPTNIHTEYASVNGYNAGPTAGIAFGLGIDFVSNTTRVVPFDVETPAHTTTKVVPASQSLDAIKSPVLLVDPEGLIDSVVFNNQTGPAALTFEDRDLKKKLITTDKTKVAYPTTASSATNTDLVAQLSGLSSAGRAAVIDTLNDYIENLVLFNDRYFDGGLIDRVRALAGSATEAMTIAAGVSYVSFQDTLNDGGQIVTARSQLDSFLSGTGFTAHYTSSPHPDPSRTDRLYDISSISNSAGKQLQWTGEYRTFVKDGVTYKDLIGVSLVTASSQTVRLQAGFVTSKTDVSTEHWNTFRAANGSPFVYFSNDVESFEADLNATSASTVAMNDDLFDGKAVIRSGAGADTFNVTTIAGLTFIYGGDGDDTFNVGSSGLVTGIGTDLFLIGEGGTDGVVVTDTAQDQADLLLDKNTVQHVFSQDRLSKITNALEYNNVTASESALMDAALSTESVAYAKLGAVVSMSDLQMIARRTASGAAASIEAALADAKSTFSDAIDALVLQQQKDFKTFISGTLADYAQARQAKETAQGSYNYYAGQNYFKIAQDYLTSYDSARALLLPLAYPGGYFPSSADILANPSLAWSVTTNKFFSSWGLYIDSSWVNYGKSLQSTIQQQALRQQADQDLLTSPTTYVTTDAIETYFTQVADGTAAATVATATINASSAISARLAQISTDIRGAAASTLAAFDTAKAAAHTLANATGSVTSAITSLQSSLGSLLDTLKATAAPGAPTLVRLIRLDSIKDVLFADENARLTAALSLSSAIPAHSVFDTAAAFASKTNATFQDALNLFNNSGFKGIISAYKSAQELAQNFDDYKTATFSAFRQAYLNVTKFEVFKYYLEGTFDFNTFKTQYEANVSQLNNSLGLFDSLAKESQLQSKLDSLQHDQDVVHSVMNHNDAVVGFFGDLKTAADQNLTTVQQQLYTAYTITISFFGFSFSIHLDYSNDPRYKSAVQQVSTSTANYNLAVARQAQAVVSKTAVDNDVTNVQAQLATLSAQIDAQRDALADLKETLDRQYRFLRSLSGVAINVLTQTRAGQAAADFEDTSSLISEVQSQTEAYTISDAAGVTSSSETFAAGPTGNSVIKQTRTSDYFDVLSLTGASPGGIHADYGSVENFTVITGGTADHVTVHDSLGQAGSNVYVRTGDGDDYVVVSDQTASVDRIVGNVLVDAGTGHNQILIDDHGDTAGDGSVVQAYNGTYVKLSGMSAGTISYKATGGDFSAGLDVLTSSGSDGITISALYGGDHTVLNSGTGNDTITVTSFAVDPAALFTIYAGDGNDAVDAGAAPLFLTVYGQGGSDSVLGSMYNDLLLGQDGHDVVEGNGGVDTISGGTGEDILFGERGTVTFTAGGVRATAAATVTTFGSGDSIHGDDGDDILFGGLAGDELFGDAGNNVTFGDHGSVAFDTLGRLLTLTGSQDTGAADSIRAGDGNDVVLGGFGSDSVDGGDGDDVLLGDEGVVTFANGTFASAEATHAGTAGGDDVLTDMVGDNTVLGGAGADSITLGDGSQIVLGDHGVIDRTTDDGNAATLDRITSSLAGDGGNDTIATGAGNDTVMGGAGDDSITGAGGQNVLVGDSADLRYVNGLLASITSVSAGIGGDDTITAGAGNDIAIGGAGSDSIGLGDGHNVAAGDAATAAFDGPDNDALTLDSFATQAPSGNEGNDSITAGSGNDTILGGLGADSLDAGSGDNVVLGDNGAVTLHGGSLDLVTSADTASGGGDRITSLDGDDVIVGGTGNDLIDAGGGRNVALGDNGEVDYSAGTLLSIRSIDGTVGGNDTVTTAAGNDLIIGGAGADSLSAGDADNVVAGDAATVTYNGPDGDANTLDLLAAQSGGLGADADSISTGSGDDVIVAGLGDDTVSAGDGRNTVVADQGAVTSYNGQLSHIESTDMSLGGDDSVTTGSGDDIVVAGAGSDTITVGNGNNVAFGDNAQLDFRQSTGVLTSAESTAGADGSADSITTGSGDDLIVGGADSDTIAAGDGDNRIAGDFAVAMFDGLDNDLSTLDTFQTTDPTLAGGADSITTGTGDDLILGGLGADMINAGTGNNVVAGDDAAVTQYGGKLDLVTSTDTNGGGADSITAGSGNDTIVAGFGDDTVAAGDGHNVVLGDSAELDFGQGTGALLTAMSTDGATGGSDSITTGIGSDLIVAGAGSDTVDAGGGDNVVVGDAATAAFNGADGNAATLDSVTTPTPDGGEGGDSIVTGSGNDLVIGGLGDDVISAGGADNMVLGDNGAVTLFAGKFDLIASADAGVGGNDSVTSLAGNDTVVAGFGDDTVGAGDGRNVILGDNGGVDFGQGTGTLLTATSTSLNIGGTDSIATGSGDDLVIAGDGSDNVNAGAGNNVVAADVAAAAYNGPDGDSTTLDSIQTLLETTGAGNDTVTTGSGNDVVLGGLGSDVLNVDAGSNVVFGDDVTVTFYGGKVTLGQSADTTLGGNDSITSLGGSDTVVAGFGDDTVSAGDGDNIVIGDNGKLAFVLGTGALARAETTSPADGGADALVTGTGDDIVLGGAGADTIRGGAGCNIVTGDNGIVDTIVADNSPADIDLITTWSPNDGGNDDIQTLGGNDVILGGTGADTIDSDAGNDLVVGDHGKVGGDFNCALIAAANPGFTFTSIDTGLADGGGNDAILAGSGNDIVVAGQGADVVYAGAGDDDVIGGHTLAGGSDGADSIDGGTGNDVIVGDNGRVLRTGSSLSARFNTLTASTIYDPATGTANVAGVPQNNPGGASERSIVLYDHSGSTPAGLFGDDYVAGGAGDDSSFGGLGNDTIQGDGSIDLSVGYGRPSVESATDGDDYIEGNGGNDVIFGNLGQDDILGGSSDLFGLTTPATRPDGADTIYGGAGTEATYNDPGRASDDGHARDADFIVGDNGHIIRLVAASGAYLAFNYDYYSTLHIVPRALVRLDYTIGGSVSDIGTSDLIHGESGDDSIHGQAGGDVLFGDGQDDDIIGGTGADRIYGGTGEDGVLGDDGVILTSRNGLTEPLSGLTAPNVATNISMTGPFTGAWVYISGRLFKTVDALAWNVGAADVIYGGLGDDFLHGGAGDDAISGSEATAAFWSDAPVTNTNPLGYDPVTRKFAAYDAVNPLQKISGFFLNFDATTAAGSKIDDGKDNIFGDLGNDWLVGGTDNDRLFGGVGDDLMNADDNLDTNAGANDAPDATLFADRDFVYGGDGLDVMIANTGGDRLFDWSGEFNTYVVPYSAFGSPTVERSPSPAIQAFLLDLGKSAGADQSLAEPNGELGLFTQSDPQWGANRGSPRDPQSTGHGGAARDTQGAPEDDRSTALPLTGPGTLNATTAANSSIPAPTTNANVVADLADVTSGHAFVSSDPSDPTHAALFVGGTDAAEKIDVRKGTTAGTIRVMINGVNAGVFPTGTGTSAIGRIIVYANGGNDSVTIFTDIGAIPAVVYGGAGNDSLVAGAGSTVLDGGDGDDWLLGGAARDFLIGGQGKDTLNGAEADDILLAGAYAESSSLDALAAVMSVWNSSAMGYADRVAVLRTGTGTDGIYKVTAATVFDDNLIDVVTGSNGDDWFFGSAADQMDRKNKEILN